ncbi:hypothetical protein AKJ52_01530 [candidate division MSBL1 archaeon SCGC-AAA382C18]|uniref:histidine kinase n=1 Tax=candidate division MSBL1 archaeon SCGC-AAA382C18 TaxID=1698281 RepID=A0A133VK63_9EURY|nr:hypothetical protein AKJ52_01530 [candidate division MSBL1 archaeon SCGC-AAA382C18]
MFEEGDFDGVVSDYQMPGKDGLDLLKILREDKESDIPFIIFTGKGREDVAIEALNLGADRYLQKGGSPKSQYGVLAHAIKQEIEVAQVRELKTAKNQLNRLVSETPTVIFTYKPSNPPKITFLSKNIKEELGFEPEEFKNDFEHWKDFVHPDDLPAVWEKMQELLETGHISHEYRFKDSKGNYHWLHDKQNLLTAESGKKKVFGAWIDISSRKKAENRLKNRAKVERKVSETSSRYAGDYDFDEITDKTLADVGEVVGASRSYLFQFRENGEKMDNTHEWCAEGVSPQIDNLQDLPSDMFPWWMEKLRNGETIHIEDVSELPEEAEAEKETLESQNIKSVLVLPVFESNELAGFVGFDDCEEIGDWSDEALFALRMISTTIGNSLEKRRVEDALRERESRLQNLFDTMSEGVILTDPDGQIVEANPAAERILGLERSEIEGRNYVDPEWDIIRPDGSPMPAEEMAGPRAMREKRSIENVEMGVRQPDGSVTWIMVSASPLLREDENLEGIVGTFVDITERKRAEEELKKAEEKYRRIFEQFQDLYYRTDMDGNLVELSPSVEPLTGYEREELMGKPATTVYSDPADREDFLRELREKGSVENYELTLQKQNGERVVASANSHIMVGENGEPVGIEGTLRDITERKKPKRS